MNIFVTIATAFHHDLTQHFQRPWKKRTLYQRRFIAERRLFSKCWWRPKKQHFPAFSQKFYFALVRTFQKMKAKMRCLEGASSALNNVLSMLNNVLSTLNNALSTVCPWFVHGLIFWKYESHKFIQIRTQRKFFPRSLIVEISIAILDI